jgi:lambda repressor-like predicted transcriptional regulator
MVNILPILVTNKQLVLHIMHPADIKAALARQGISLSTLAQELNVSPQAISQTLYRYAQSRSHRIEAAIAAKLELPIEHVFPDRNP